MVNCTLTNEKFILELKGYSGSKVYLMQVGNEFFVRKKGNVARNYERLTKLYDLNYSVVKILNYHDDILDLEYIPGLDIKNYLIQHNPKLLIKFIIDVVNKLKLSSSTNRKNYTEIYKQKINWISNLFSFSIDNIIDVLPKYFFESDYFGDFTLENIIYNKKRGFIIIDPATIEYDSWVFDLAKLNQDLTCKWFLRDDKTNLDTKLKIIKNSLEEEFGEFDKNLTILMLLRIYRHVGSDFKTKQFLDRQINLLWK